MIFYQLFASTPLPITTLLDVEGDQDEPSLEQASCTRHWNISAVSRRALV